MGALPRLAVHDSHPSVPHHSAGEQVMVGAR